MNGSGHLVPVWMGGLILGVSGCLPPHAVDGVSRTRDVEGIQSLVQQREQAGRDANVQSWLDCFTDDAVIMPANAPAVVGKRAIEAWERGFEGYRPSVKVRIVELAVHQNWAYIRTELSGEFRLGGERFPIAGKELAILKRVHGQWKFHRLCGNHSSGARFEHRPQEGKEQ